MEERERFPENCDGESDIPSRLCILLMAIASRSGESIADAKAQGVPESTELVDLS